MSQELEEGKIELIIGPMFSGKSTRLIGLIRKYTYKAKKTIMIKFFAVNRYTDKSEVVTHDLLKYDSIDCKNLRDHLEQIKSYDVIGIDEGQFFPDLVEVCEELALMKKTIIVAALNGDFRMEPFPVVAKLISIIGAGEAYKPACRECHIYFSKEREKGNLNIDKILKEKENQVDDSTPIKEKESKELSSSSAETSPSPAKRELQTFTPNCL